ncbi:MAG: sugar phosphate isomerase/epimerase [Kiritimatiellae bacterium]|nr:sugar phosphate isomerase/epimerase [Kiritimatiellia bacterium]
MTRPYPVSIQLYSVRDACKEGFPATLKKIAGMGYAGVEFAGLHGHTPEEIRNVLDDLGLKASSCHAGLPTEENVAQAVAIDRALGYDMHVSAGPGFKREVSGTAEILEACKRLQKGAELLKAEGIRAGVHNHEFEFDREFDGKTPHQIMVENCPDLLFQIDTYWVAVGQKDPVAAIKNLGARCPSLHIKDGPKDKSQPMTAVGDGKMDWAPILDAADEIGAVEWIVVEIDRVDGDMLQAVDRSVKFLIDQGYGKGR